MGANREGSYILTEQERVGARRSLWVMIAPNIVLVENTPVAKLGFQYNQALQASRQFAQELYSVSKQVADQQPAKAPDPAAPADVYQQQLQSHQDSLKLNEDTRYATLEKLRTLGAPHRAELSEEMVKQFKFNGFLQDAGQEEPGLNFQEDERAPILWEMLYEGGQEGDADWQQFWGFRVPISHWINRTRTEEIWLRNGFFAAINEDLEFAGGEVDSLAQRLNLPRYSLAEALREHVHQTLLSQMDANQAENWLSQNPHIWLQRFLSELAPDEAICLIKADRWKKDKLIAIFKDPRFCYDLIHFACHCQPSEHTEFLSSMEMKVAGELVCLDVSLMATDLHHEPLTARSPGPLVFLNACGTAQQSPSYEPPGFPKKWIWNQSALAVIATLCPVPDYFAHAFAMQFYDTLFKALTEANKPKPDPNVARNCYIAEALLATRRHFMEQYNNPLGLAYVIYAMKKARVLADFL